MTVMDTDNASNYPASPLKRSKSLKQRKCVDTFRLITQLLSSSQTGCQQRLEKEKQRSVILKLHCLHAEERHQVLCTFLLYVLAVAYISLSEVKTASCS